MDGEKFFNKWKIEHLSFHLTLTTLNHTRNYTPLPDFEREEKEREESLCHDIRNFISLEARDRMGRKFSPFQLLRVLDLVPDGAGQAVRGLLPAPVDPPVLEIELVLRYILRAAVAAPSVLQYRFATSLIRVVLRARAYAPMMIERRIIHAEYLIANGHAPLCQFLARPVRPSAHLRIHISPPFLPSDFLRGRGRFGTTCPRSRVYDSTAPLRFERARERERRIDFIDEKLDANDRIGSRSKTEDAEIDGRNDDRAASIDYGSHKNVTLVSRKPPTRTTDFSKEW